MKLILGKLYNPTKTASENYNILDKHIYTPHTTHEYSYIQEQIRQHLIKIDAQKYGFRPREIKCLTSDKRDKTMHVGSFSQKN